MKEILQPYAPPNSSLAHWEFSSTVLNGLAIAVLSTFLSYQLSSMISDILLGLKQKNIAPVHSFQTLLLVRRSSPLAIANALLRRDYLTRMYFKRQLEEDEKLDRDGRKIRPGVTLRLFALLFSAPIINVIAVVVALESEGPVTFGDAEVQLGLGLNENLNTVIKSEPVFGDCHDFMFDLRPGDSAEATFRMCNRRTGVHPGNPARTAAVRIEVVSNVVVSFQVAHGHLRDISFSFMLLRSKKRRTSLVVNVLTTEQAVRLANRGLNIALEACGTGTKAEDIDDIIGATDEQVTLNVTKLFNGACNLDDSAELLDRMLLKLLEQITLVNTDQMQVFRDTQNVYADKNETGIIEDASDDIFLKRRRRNVGLAFLGLACLLAVGLRMVLSPFLQNDVQDGMERIVKERLGFKYCESMLSSGEFMVDYIYPLQKRCDLVLSGWRAV